MHAVVAATVRVVRKKLVSCKVDVGGVGTRPRVYLLGTWGTFLLPEHPCTIFTTQSIAAAACCFTLAY